MAKKKEVHNIITDLVQLVGSEDAQKILGVHKNTIYKWTVPMERVNARIPNSSAQNLAALALFLIQTCEWTIQEVVDSFDTVEEMVASYG